MALLTTLVLAVSTLLGGFRNPPQEARPQTWWHWMNGNVSREGIVADLDAMAAIGLGGVTIFDAGCDVPEGPLCFGTEEWFDTVRFAAHEAHRRGLEVILSNCSGWSSSGGPWIAPSNSMMFVEFGSVDVTGPGRREVGLPPIRSKGGYAKDVAGLPLLLRGQRTAEPGGERGWPRTRVRQAPQGAGAAAFRRLCRSVGEGHRRRAGRQL